MKRPTLNSNTQDEFIKKGTPYAQPIKPQGETVSCSFGPRKVCGNSTTNEVHSGKTAAKADLARWGDHFKLQGPFLGVTSYNVLPSKVEQIP